VSSEEALRELQDKAGSQFDPVLISMFAKIVFPASLPHLLSP